MEGIVGSDPASQRRNRICSKDMIPRRASAFFTGKRKGAQPLSRGIRAHIAAPIPPGGRDPVGILVASCMESVALMGDGDEGLHVHDVPWFVNLLRVRTGFPREVFDLVVLPALERVSASSASGATTDRLVLQRMAVAARALELRRGLVLPRGMPPELVGGLAHRWTWAVTVAALADVIAVEGAGSQREATTCAGFERMAPSAAIDWLLEDTEATAALRAFLSGDGDRGGPLVSIISRAEQDVLGARSDLRSAEGLSAVAGSVETVAVPAQDAAASPIARAFLEWVSRAVRNGSIEINTSRAVVCRLAEGTLLVVPGVFREYARCVALGECPWPPGLSVTGRDPARTIRREVAQAGWHVPSAAGAELVDGLLAGGAAVRGLLLRPSVTVLGDDVPVAGTVLPTTTEA